MKRYVQQVFLAGRVFVALIVVTFMLLYAYSLYMQKHNQNRPMTVKSQVDGTPVKLFMSLLKMDKL